MSEMSRAERKKARKVHHTGRTSQIGIYLGKQLRFFISQSDWKVLPMAAVIAALVGMVIRKRFFVSMEGSLIGAFALVCVAIWNGCFNSIQSVCRERPIVKREHRSGMHISAYVAAHMIYQFLLCAGQTVLTMFVLRQLSVPIPRGQGSGFITPWMILDLGITMFLITYAADMMSLFISSIARTTTSAMTIMPFILIFQLVFAGSVIPLPEWSKSLANLTISNYGIRALAAQSGYNDMPSNTVWNMVTKMKDSEVGGTVSVGDILDKLDNPVVEKQRDREIVQAFTVGDLAKMLADPAVGIADRKVGDQTLGEILDQLQKDEEAAGVQITTAVTVGNVVDFLKTNEAVQANRDKAFTLKMNVGDVFELIGEENVKNFVQQKTSEASFKPEYIRTEKNIARNWVFLGLFIIVFAALATVALELIDKDKR